MRLSVPPRWSRVPLVLAAMAGMLAAAPGQPLAAAAAQAGPATAAWSVTPVPPVRVPNMALAAVSCPSATWCMTVGFQTNQRQFDALPQQAVAEIHNGAAWRPAPPPVLAGDQTTLLGVSCPQVNACMAVGTQQRTTTASALAEWWDGTSWRALPVPLPAGVPLSELLAVSCVSATMCVAVGDDFVSSTGQAGNLVEQWDGSHWSSVTVPGLPSGDSGGLRGVTCRSAADCVAVGGFVPPPGSPPGYPEVLAWNGARWQAQPTPQVPGAQSGQLLSVSCPSASWCTATGTRNLGTFSAQPLAEVWSAGTWRVTPVPGSVVGFDRGLSGVACTSVTVCQAAGSTGHGTNIAPWAAGWNGTKWTSEPVPNPDHNTTATHGAFLTGVSCPASSQCVAVGPYSEPIGTVVSRADLWDGQRWTTQALPQAQAQTSAILNAVSCPAPTACMAAGGAFFGNTVNGDGTGAVSDLRTATGWAQPPVPLPPGPASSSLAGVSCAVIGSCLAVGTVGSQPMALVWNGSQWAGTPAPSPSGALSGASCPPGGGGSCEAVGVTPTSAQPQGAPLARAWNGSAWTAQNVPLPPGAATGRLLSVSCPAPQRCEAVGSYQVHPAPVLPLIEGWDGHQWSVQPLGGVRNVRLSMVSCASATVCVAIGAPAGAGRQPVAYQWDGSQWAAMPPLPLPAGAALSGLSCGSVTACVAVGIAPEAAGRGKTLAVAWNGASWSVQPTPNPSGFRDALVSVSCPSATQCTAVGVSNGQFAGNQVIVEDYHA